MKTSRKVSLICNILGGVLMVLATVLWIITYVRTKNSLNGLVDSDEIDKVLKNAGWALILGVAVPLGLTVFINIIGMMAYVFDDLKKADVRFYIKLGLVVLPLLLLVLYFAITLTLKAN